MSCILYLVVLLAVIAAAFPVSHIEASQSTTIYPRQANATCQFVGNSDFYGLGIRIGIYLQWLTGLLSNHFLQESVGTSLDTNTIFLLALFVASAVATARDNLHSTEIVVLLQLCFGFLFSILSIWGYRRSRPEEGLFRFAVVGSLFRLVLATAISAYAVWFWFSEVEVLQREPPCPDYIFMFAKVDIYQRVRTFLVIQSTIILIVYALLALRELTMINSYLLFTSIWTATVAPVTILIGQAVVAGHDAVKKVGPDSRRPAFSIAAKVIHKRLVWNAPKVISQWTQISFAVWWKQATGTESSGLYRPHLGDYLVPFINLWIIAFKVYVKFWAYLLLNKYAHVPIPLVPHPWFHSTEEHHIWAKYRAFNESVFDSRQLRWVTYAINIICLIWTVLSVELTLVWNNVEEVYTIGSTGQLIPFIIGIVSIASFLQGMAFKYVGMHTTRSLMNLLELDVCKDVVGVERYLTDNDGEETSEKLDTVSSAAIHQDHAPMNQGQSSHVEQTQLNEALVQPKLAQASIDHPSSIHDFAGLTPVVHDPEDPKVGENTSLDGSTSNFDQGGYANAPTNDQENSTHEPSNQHEDQNFRRDGEPNYWIEWTRRYPFATRTMRLSSLLVFATLVVVMLPLAPFLAIFCVKARHRQDSFRRDLKDFDNTVARYLAVRPFQVLHEQKSSSKSIRQALRDESSTSLLVVMSKFLVEVSTARTLPETALVATNIREFVKFAMEIRVQSEAEGMSPQRQHERLLEKWKQYPDMSLLAAIAKDMQATGKDNASVASRHSAEGSTNETGQEHLEEAASVRAENADAQSST